MPDKNVKEFVILIDLHKSKRFAKLLGFFTKEEQIPVKVLCLKMPVAEFYETFDNDLKRINAYLSQKNLPKVLELVLMDLNGKTVKALRRNFNYQINVADSAFTELKYTQVEEQNGK